MRQTIRLKQLPGADVSFAGGALRTLAAAASHPDVITGTGGGGITGGTSADRDEVCVWCDTHIETHTHTHTHTHLPHTQMYRKLDRSTHTNTHALHA